MSVQTAERAFLDQWATGLRIEHLAHRRASARAVQLGRILGISVVVLTTAVGTAVFGSVAGSPGTTAKIAAGAVSLAAAVLAAVQTFLALDSVAATHREAGTMYGALRRELEQLRSNPAGPSDDDLLKIRQRWDDVDATAPPIPPRLYDSSRRMVQEGVSRD
jgi:hypothetical protein